MLVKDLREALSKCDNDETVVIAMEDILDNIEFFNITYVIPSGSKNFPVMLSTSWADKNPGKLDGEE